MLNTIGFNDHRAHHDIDKHLTAVGITVPDGVTYALDVDRALQTAASPDPATDIRAALAAGDTPAKIAAHLTKTGASIAAAEQISAARTAIQIDLDRLARQALAADADRVHAELTERFNAAVADIRKAVDMFGPGLPPKAITSRTGVARIWDEAVNARQRLDAVRVVRTDLADVGYGTPLEGPEWYVEHMVDLDNAPRKAVQLIEAGIAVRLNTAAECTALTAARDAAAAAAAAQREERKRRDRENSPMARAFRQAEAIARGNRPDAA